MANAKISGERGHPFRIHLCKGTAGDLSRLVRRDAVGWAYNMRTQEIKDGDQTPPEPSRDTAIPPDRKLSPHPDTGWLASILVNILKSRLSMEIGQYDKGSVSSLSCFSKSEISDSTEWENILCRIGVI